MDVSLVPPREIFRVWPTALPYIMKSISASENRDDLDNILVKLLDSVDDVAKATLWVAFDDDFAVRAAAILEKVDYPDNVSVMRIGHIGGEQGMKWFRPMYEMFNSFAKDNDCEYLEAECVPKFDSFMKKHGALEIARVYRLPVTDQVAGD